MNEQYLVSRNLKERICVQGTLVLETPAHFGSGDSDGLVDMPLLRDALEQKALLTGSTLAGALRGLLALRSPEQAEKLFGRVSGEESRESWLIVDDAIGELPRLELRDGGAKNPKTGTAEDKKKFDFELLAAGTHFNINLELLVPRQEGDELVEALATCLEDLANGLISLGKRKRRGFGRCKVSEWTVVRYNMTTPAGMFRWLDRDTRGAKKDPSISQLLLGRALDPSALPWCELEADFDLDGSLLIRSGSGKAGEPDAVHLRSHRDGKEVPVLSGTSLAGALRAAALRIANTLGKQGNDVTDQVFGARARDGEEAEEMTASRLWVDEYEITRPAAKVQSRLKIDRLTGGAFPGALYSEQPVFGQDAGVHIRLRLFEPTKGDVGLLLLLLKDLWLGDLTLGGESGVGRGRVKGKNATLRYAGKTWTIRQEESTVSVRDGNGMNSKAALQEFVDVFTGAKHE